MLRCFYYVVNFFRFSHTVSNGKTPTGSVKTPEKAAKVIAYLLFILNNIPEKTEKLATIIATAAQNLLIVRQKFQHTILQSTSEIVMGWGCHHIRQYTTQDITINPLKIGKIQLTF